MVSYNYLPKQFINPEPIFDDIRELIKTGDFTLGQKVTDFEVQFASLLGAKHAIGVGSGTDAIKLSLKACGIKAGDGVITAANTFVATIGAICELGARPVFVDVQANYVMDTGLIRKAIEKEKKGPTPIKAIVPVHFTGEPVEMDEVMNVAKEYDLKIIEDACQSILAKYKEKTCGTIGHCGAFSLHPLKNINVWADGGVIVTNSDEYAKKLKLLRNHGLKNRDEVTVLGFNSRLDTIQAIVGLHLLPHALEITKKRQENAKYYDKHLAACEFITLPPHREHCEPVYHLYMFRVPSKWRNPLVDYLNNQSIEAKVHYPIPIYRQEALDLICQDHFPFTDIQADQVVSIPVDQHVTRPEQDYVIDRIAEFFA